MTKDKSNESVGLHGEIIKLDEDRRLVFGWASVSDVGGKPLLDRQGDVIAEHDLEEMAYNFLLNKGTAGEMHERIGIGDPVECMAFTREKQKALGIDLGKTGWWVGFKIRDDGVWKRVKSGDLKAFSIHGTGNRRKLEA